MLVCICKALSERDIAAAMERGSCCLQCLEDSCGAGTGCGACREWLQDMLRARAPGGEIGAQASLAGASLAHHRAGAD